MIDRGIWEGYSYRLSGLIYCADCGHTGALSVPTRSTVEDTTIPILPFNAETIEAKNGECVSHYVKKTAQEVVILQAIKTIGKYVIENEAEFISELKTV